MKREMAVKPTVAAQWYENPIFERVPLAEVRAGEIVHLASGFWNGELLGWKIRGYKVDGAEDKGSGVWFLQLAEESRTPGGMNFIMLCGNAVHAGVLRRRRSEEPAA